MSTHNARMLPGLLALHRRKLGLPRLADDEAAIGALDAAVRRRALRRFVIGGRRHPEREADCDDVAGDVLVRLVTAPESVLAVVARFLAHEGPLDALPQVEGAAERIARGYVAAMLYHRTVEVERRRGNALVNPMSVDDIFAALELLEDPTDLEAVYNDAERRAYAARCRAQLDEAARRVGASGRRTTFVDAYAQLWRLADELTTTDELSRETGVAEAALHQRHCRAREDLIEEIEGSAKRGALDAATAQVLVDIVTVHLRRRQTGPARGVLQPMTPTEGPSR